MKINNAKEKFFEEFTDKYSELFVSVFILKYQNNFNEKELYNDIMKCLNKLDNKVKILIEEELNNFFIEK